MTGTAAAGMVVGVDFDNTIVSYDVLFHRLASHRGLVPAHTPATKQAVRDHLRQAGQEQLWTELQGVGYGAELGGAPAFAGVTEFFTACREHGVRVLIISHRTRYPYAGEVTHDLHAAARDWLEQQGFHDPAGAGLDRARVFFELTKAEKLARVATEGCTHFIDDLPELLLEPGFPAGVQRILFDPGGVHPDAPAYVRVGSWAAITAQLLGTAA